MKAFSIKMVRLDEPNFKIAEFYRKLFQANVEFHHCENKVEL